MMRALLCYDGSEGARHAIEAAGELLTPRDALVLVVCEPLHAWCAYDPGAILGAATSKLFGEALGVDDMLRESAHETLEQGVKIAQTAGFGAEGRVEEGKAWRTICDVAEAEQAAVIVVGSRGGSRTESVLLGSVASGVLAHAARPVLVVPRGHGE
jgi:nucleotide-binding universal stress UspA family protein